MKRKTKIKTIKPGKKLPIKGGGFYCKIELPPLSKFKSEHKNISPYQLFYVWLSNSLEATNGGRLLEILFGISSKDKLQLKDSFDNFSLLNRSQPLIDCSKVVTNPKVVDQLNRIQGDWAVKFKHTTRKGKELYLAFQNLAYGPSENSKVPDKYVYVKTKVFFIHNKTDV